MAAGPQPRASEPQELAEPLARDVAQPEAGEQRVDLAIGRFPCVAQDDARAQPVRLEPPGRDRERLAVGVGDREVSLLRQQRRPPARARGQLEDLAREREPVEPARRLVELGLPRGVVEGSALVPAAAQVEVVVLGCAGRVVGAHLGVEVGERGGSDGRRGGGSGAGAAAPAARAAPAPPTRLPPAAPGRA